MFAHTWYKGMKAQSLEMTVICLGEINNKRDDINEHLLCARRPVLRYYTQERTQCIGDV